MKTNRYDNLPQIAAESNSLKEILDKLGLADSGGNRQHIKRRLAAAGIATPKKSKSTIAVENVCIEKFSTAVRESKSLARILRVLDLGKSSKLYPAIIRRAQAEGLSMEHFTGQRWNTGKINLEVRKKSLARNLVLNGPLTRATTLKESMIVVGLKTGDCEICGIKPSWNGMPLTMHLDHIDGNRSNNIITNLRIVCPNCHTQTPTYANKRRQSTCP